MGQTKDKYSAGEQALGYLYQIRLALLLMMELPEGSACLIEKDDDIQFETDGGASLASLKHKAPGDRLTDLSPDFWKSVRIWLTRYTDPKWLDKDILFFLFTTSSVADNSFLVNFLQGKDKPIDLASHVIEILEKSKSDTLIALKNDLNKLELDRRTDFLNRISIFDSNLRIHNIPDAIMDRMRAVRPAFRQNVYERLEGWWTGEAINLLSGKRKEPAYSGEVSEKLASYADQFKADSLPIDFRGKEPPDSVDPNTDSRPFVDQLRMLDLKPNRIRRAILDYYRAFEQRASWAREQVTVNGEVEEYDDRLVDAWERHKCIVCEELDEEAVEALLRKTGVKLLTWAETVESPSVRIRPNVDEPYVTIGSYHMLANELPLPRIHWHPHYIKRISEIVANKTT